ncbi:hypothetical protein AB0C77_31670 [Streptomyces sp. NPDC048629]|uniref:hypothetical protein n=1 Tax=Streptomyces sp. NPDC048629 TaxID=3154824 RepID=UPI003426BD69
MSANEQWNPDLLRSPANRAIHMEQRRAQLQPIADDLRRLAREVEAELKEVGALDGDLPGQAWMRALQAVRPLFRAADDLEKSLADLVAFNKRYQRSYEELPEKREAKRQQKALAKGQPQQAIGPSPTGGQAAGGDISQFGDVFDGLRKGA